MNQKRVKNLGQHWIIVTTSWQSNNPQKNRIIDILELGQADAVPCHRCDSHMWRGQVRMCEREGVWEGLGEKVS